jgi:UDP-N-acetylmuramoyl-tripeptide--D-alanyl-D-alanine ligase
MELGAEAVVTERPVEGARCMIVDSTARALLDIAGYYRSKFDVKVVGVTGSVGKTTTKDMIALVVAQKYKTLKTQGNHNNEIGMPQTLFGLDSSYEAAVIEMGMSHQGEISRMSMSCQPDVAVITNIGISHIENLGTQENILKAKLEILDGAAYDAPLILCRDDKLLAGVQLHSDRKVYYYSVSKKDCDVYASGVKTVDNSITFTINYEGGKISAQINCLGEHNVKNALAAFCVGLALDIPPEDIVKGIAQFKPEGLRQNVTVIDGVTYIVDCYNAAPDSMKASLSVLSQAQAEGKRICVLGDMLELGKNSKTYHRNVGEYVAASKADLLYCFGEDSKCYIEGAEKKGFAKENCRHFESRDDLAAALKEVVAKGDAVLFKGSRGMKLEEVFNALTK